MGWACIEKRRRQESGGDGDAGEKKKEGEAYQIGGGWITSRTACLRENCQGRKLNTEFN